MNERIQELAKQAGGEFYTGFAGSPNSVKFMEENFEKFALLIVRECAKVSEQSQWLEAKGEYYEGFNEAMIYVANQIKEHFGVE